MGKTRRNHTQERRAQPSPTRQRKDSHLREELTDPRLRSPRRPRVEPRSQTNKQYKKPPVASVFLSRARREKIETTLNSTLVRNFFTDDNDLYKQGNNSDFKREFLRVINGSVDDNLRRAVEDAAEKKETTAITAGKKATAKTAGKKKATAKTAGNTDPHELSLEYRVYYLFMLEHPKYVATLEQRQKLPVFKMKDKILEVISNNNVVVISGATGCGKTTQVPQFILDDFLEKAKGADCRIWSTQPSRIVTMSVARRVAYERVEKPWTSVGYQIRLERKLPRDRASIRFCTTGAVVKNIQADPTLSSVSHLILDEIHERNAMCDLILALVKKITQKRKDLKVILMSATLNAEQFSKYFDNAPHIEIPASTFPVQEFYLEDVLLQTEFKYEKKFIPQKEQADFQKFIDPHIKLLEKNKRYNPKVYKQLRNPLSEKVNIDLILSLLVKICKKEEDQDAILVFLTGYEEISALCKKIADSKHFPTKKYLIIPIHSFIPTLDTKKMFETPPKGQRKIILATNIAETSITIDDVVYVIDCGKVKLNNFDFRTNSNILTPQWVSLANANQRKGRAGRVKPGVCFHLFSTARKNFLEKYQSPEILRRRLEDVILTAKMLQLGKVAPFFAQMMDPPHPENVTTALNMLKQMNALTEDEKLTPLGYHLAKLPMASQIGKMVLFGTIFSCLDPILSIAATLNYKAPFTLPIGQEKQVHERKLQLSNGSVSDHLLFHKVVQGFETSDNRRQYCKQNFLCYHTMMQLLNTKKQFMHYLHDMNFVPDVDPQHAKCNRNSNNVILVKAIICAGLYPNVAILSHLENGPVWNPYLRQKLYYHPKSILINHTHFPTNLLVYYNKTCSGKDYIQDCTLIHPLPIIFFGDKFEEVEQNDNNNIFINGNMKFVCKSTTSSLIRTLRQNFNLFLEYKIANPGPVFWYKNNPSVEIQILEMIVEMITCEETEREGHS